MKKSKNEPVCKCGHRKSYHSHKGTGYCKARKGFCGACPCQDFMSRERG